MSRGVKGSGQSTAKRRQSRKPMAAENKAAVSVAKSNSSIFGAHGAIIDRMRLGAELAEIVEHNLNVLATDLDAFDKRTSYDFGKKVLDKVVQAGVDAIVNLDINRTFAKAPPKTETLIKTEG